MEKLLNRRRCFGKKLKINLCVRVYIFDRINAFPVMIKRLGADESAYFDQFRKHLNAM